MSQLLIILHILGASFLFITLLYISWIFIAQAQNFSSSIKILTRQIIFPLAFWQMLSGFSLIRLNAYEPSAYWIKASIFVFILFIGSWILLIPLKFRRGQGVMLGLALFAILCMIFLMTNKIM